MRTLVPLATDFVRCGRSTRCAPGRNAPQQFGQNGGAHRRDLTPHWSLCPRFRSHRLAGNWSILPLAALYFYIRYALRFWPPPEFEWLARLLSCPPFIQHLGSRTTDNQPQPARAPSRRNSLNPFIFRQPSAITDTRRPRIPTSQVRFPAGAQICFRTDHIRPAAVITLLLGLVS